MGKQGRCEFWNEEENLGNVMLYCPKLVLSVKEIELRYDLCDLLQRCSWEKCYLLLF